MTKPQTSRACAVRLLTQVLNHGRTIEHAETADPGTQKLSESDRQFVHLILLTTVRRLGQIDAVLGRLLRKPLRGKLAPVNQILRISVAQYLFLKTPAYAVVNTAVELTRALGFAGMTRLVNGVLRTLERQADPLAGTEVIQNIPLWLRQVWEAYYGSDMVRQTAEAVLIPPPLDITVAGNAADLARRWQGVVLPTGGVRVAAASPTELEGFQTGKCWVQNGAASVPAQLLGDVAGLRVADLCAAPGGKTAQLATRGAHVAAYDISDKRLERLRENMRRLGLENQISVHCGDILTLTDRDIYDAVLLDAPCSATGTIARHPEVMYHQTPADVARLAELQRQMLRQAIALTKPGGRIVFSTCSVQPEEGDAVVQAMGDQITVMRPTDDRWKPFLTPFGSLRFLPAMGYDGFYACLMRRR